MAGQRLRYTAALIALAFAIGLTFLVPLIVGITIDHGLRGDPIDRTWLAGIVSAETLRQGLWWLGLVIVGLTAFASVFMFLEGVLANQASESIVRRLRDRLFDRLQHLTCSYHDKAETGDLVQRCTSDVETTRAFLATQVIEIVRALSNLFIALPVLFWLNWQLAIVSTCVLPVIVGFALVFFRVVQSTFKNMDEAEGALTARVQENLTNIRVVRAFARQSFEQEKFDARNADHRAKHWTLYRVFAVYWSVSDFLVFVQMGLALFVGASFVASGRMPVGELVTFWLYVGLMVWPVRQMGRTLSELGKALVALQRIDEVLSAPIEQDKADQPDALPDRLEGRIVLRDIGFGHQDGQPILNGLSFEVEPGQTLAIQIKRLDGKRQLMTPDGQDLIMPEEPEAKDHIVTAIGRSYRWRERLMEPGMSINQLAEQEGCSRQFFYKYLRLINLGPDLLKLVLAGHLPPRITLIDLLKAANHLDWQAQFKYLNLDPSSLPG